MKDYLKEIKEGVLNEMKDYLNKKGSPFLGR
jgi:hypothetical protein